MNVQFIFYYMLLEIVFMIYIVKHITIFVDHHEDLYAQRIIIIGVLPAIGPRPFGLYPGRILGRMSPARFPRVAKFLLTAMFAVYHPLSNNFTADIVYRPRVNPTAGQCLRPGRGTWRTCEIFSPKRLSYI